MELSKLQQDVSEMRSVAQSSPAWARAALEDQVQLANAAHSKNSTHQIRLIRNEASGVVHRSWFQPGWQPVCWRTVCGWKFGLCYEFTQLSEMPKSSATMCSKCFHKENIAGGSKGRADSSGSEVSHDG